MSTDASPALDRAIAELVAENRRRRKIRRTAGFISIPFVLVAVLVVAKVLSMFSFAHFAMASYADGNGNGTTSAAQGQLPANWFEPYKAPFNQGDGYALSGQLPEAREQFENALALARGLEECVVRVNLSLTVERMGDAAAASGDHDLAHTLFTEALGITADTPPECHNEEANEFSSDPSRDLGDTTDENRQRQQGKANRTDEQETTPSDPSEESETKPGPPSDELSEIERKLQQGQQERDEGEQGGDTGGGTDKPW